MPTLINIFDQGPLGQPHVIDTVPLERPNRKGRMMITFGKLEGGTYAISNKASDHLISLADPDEDGTALCAAKHHDLTDDVIKWIVTKYGNDTYSIVNQKEELWVTSRPSPPAVRTDSGGTVVGRRTTSTPTRWYVREGSRAGHYIVGLIENSSLCWYLPDGNSSTLVKLAIPNSESDSAIKEEFLWVFQPLGADTVPLFSFTFRLNCSPADCQSMSFIEQPLDINLQNDFTLLAWVFCDDRTHPRSIISFESPQCEKSLLALALPPAPQKNVLQFSYASSARRDDLVGYQGKTELPPLGVWFHVALVFSTTGCDTFKTYVNGLEDTELSANHRVFPAKDIAVVIGAKKFLGRTTAQWSGSLENVHVHQAALTKKQISDNMAKGSLRRLPPISCPGRNDLSPITQCQTDEAAVEIGIQVGGVGSSRLSDVSES
ncbi:hypothetical protein JAAARDRAFT_38804 [Jaapia argillacea MUCL 33604]|uniref:Uncharacterized protein n=1 Tax=Jaapia argillacea MUCL 33604 TaxID=933084 RepID=A0A067PG03_9AGAM|nr:hypothetical protein JAAARDRAFT_38804 [Jaapia argillacea MUCL 33604]